MSNLYSVLLAPLVSEKAMQMNAQTNTVAFWVRPDATKHQIKKAIEHFFKVTVLKVSTLNTRPTTTRFGRTLGVKKAKKKAYIRLAVGQTISLAQE